MADDLCFLPATELAARIRRRDVSPVEAVDAFLARIERVNPKVNAYVHLLGDSARQQAREAEQAVMRGDELPPLHGIPTAIKDLFEFMDGVPNTMGSVPFKDFVPNFTAENVARILRAGAIPLGKTNTPEFGHKGITDNYIFGATSTPFKPGYNSGGSSGGSASAMGASLCTIAQGSDGGGSIRIPASFSGVYGFKASWGRIPMAARPNGYFHTPFVHSGPLTKTVDDAALMLSVMTGPYARDPMTVPDDGMDFRAATRKSIKGLRVGYSPRFEIFPVDARVSAVVDTAVKAFTEVGATVEEVKVPFKHDQYELSLLWNREIGVLTASNWENFKAMGIDLDARRSELTPEWAWQVDLGREMSAVQYKRSDEMRTAVFDAIQDVFENYDLLVTPTLAIPPVKNATDGHTLAPAEINGEKVETNIGWCLTYPINFSGHPAASIPAGFTDDGLPIGMQIIGPRFRDDLVFAASAAFERVRPWLQTYPRDL